MASFYTRTGSPYYWVRFQKPDGTWGGKSSGIRRTADGARRKIKQAVAQATMHEHTFSEQTQSNLGGNSPFWLVRSGGAR